MLYILFSSGLNRGCENCIIDVYKICGIQSIFCSEYDNMYGIK